MSTEFDIVPELGKKYLVHDVNRDRYWDADGFWVMNPRSATLFYYEQAEARVIGFAPLGISCDIQEKKHAYDATAALCSH